MRTNCRWIRPGIVGMSCKIPDIHVEDAATMWLPQGKSDHYEKYEYRILRQLNPSPSGAF